MAVAACERRGRADPFPLPFRLRTRAVNGADQVKSVLCKTQPVCAVWAGGSRRVFRLREGAHDVPAGPKGRKPAVRAGSAGRNQAAWSQPRTNTLWLSSLSFTSKQAPYCCANCLRVPLCPRPRYQCGLGISDVLPSSRSSAVSIVNAGRFAMADRNALTEGSSRLLVGMW